MNRRTSEIKEIDQLELENLIGLALLNLKHQGHTYHTLTMVVDYLDKELNIKVREPKDYFSEFKNIHADKVRGYKKLSRNCYSFDPRKKLTLRFKFMR